MIDKEKQKLNPKKQWAKFIVVGGLYLLFLLWLKSWLGARILIHTWTRILDDNHNFTVKIKNRKIYYPFAVEIFQSIKGILNNIACDKHNIMHRRHIKLTMQLAFLRQRKINIQLTAAADFTEDKAGKRNILETCHNVRNLRLTVIGNFLRKVLELVIGLHTGKTVIPFCTTASSGIGDSGNLLKDMAGTGDWKDGERFRGGASESDIRSWIDSLGL